MMSSNRSRRTQSSPSPPSRSRHGLTTGWTKFPVVQDVPRALWYLDGGSEAQQGSQPVNLVIAAAMNLRYDLTYDRIVCPYRHFNGKLAGARGRAVDQDAKLKHWDYTWGDVNNAHCVWYNEPALDAAAMAKAPVIVCEGQFDVMNVLRVYPLWSAT
jgi:hypothetical protein